MTGNVIVTPTAADEATEGVRWSSLLSSPIAVSSYLGERFAANPVAAAQANEPKFGPRIVSSALPERARLESVTGEFDDQWFD